MLSSHGATAAYSLGYSKPHSDELGFDGQHEAAYVIQSVYRGFLSKRTVGRAMSRAKVESNAPRVEVKAAEIDWSSRPSWHRSKHQLWTLFSDPTSSTGAWVLAIVMLLLILASCATFVLETLPMWHGRFQAIFFSVELVCVISFTIEFALRLLSCSNVGAFLLDKLNWVDFCSIAPFYVEQLFNSNQGAGLATLRLVRLARVFRLFKLGRHSSDLQVFASTMKQSVRPMITLIMFVLCGVVIIASIMFYTERGSFACPCGDTDHEWCDDSTACVDPLSTESGGYWVTTVDGVRIKSEFQDIPSTCYFALVTMTTVSGVPYHRPPSRTAAPLLAPLVDNCHRGIRQVGYGDVKPYTSVGQFFASCFCIFGVVVIALPISVISANFKKLFFEAEQKKQEGKEGSADLDEATRSKARDLRTLNVYSEVALTTLMEMYLQEDASSLLRVRNSVHTSLKGWIPPVWVDDLVDMQKEKLNSSGNESSADVSPHVPPNGKAQP